MLETQAPSRSQSSGPRRALFLILAAVAVSAIWLIASRWTSNEDLTDTSEAIVTPVDAVAVQAVDSVTTERYFTGRVTARRSSSLAFERSARVTAVLVDEGDRVRRGQALARLDNRDLELSKSQLEANLAAAQARLDELTAGPRKETIDAAQSQVEELRQNLELAKIQTQRRQELLDRQAISREEFDRSSFQSMSLQASLAAAQARLDELRTGTREEQIRAQQAVVQDLEARIGSVQLDMEKSTLQAPFAGRIKERFFDEGAFATPGQPAMTLVEEARPEVRIGLPADAAQQIKIGDERTVEVAGRSYVAKAAGLLPELDVETRTATVIFELTDAKPSAVFPGQIARLALVQEEQTAGYWLPLESLSRGVRGLWACHVVVDSDEPGVQTVELRQVEILSTEGDRALVRGAIQPGDLVIQSGANRVTAGQRVRASS